MTDINIHNLRLFVGALREVVEAVPEAQVVNLQSTRYPSCCTPGCHAGLAMLALDRLGVPGPYGYAYDIQAKRLSDYLMTEPSSDGYSTKLQEWAEENPDVWGGPHGDWMFTSGVAFGESDRATFQSTIIADKWAAVLARLEEKP